MEYHLPVNKEDIKQLNLIRVLVFDLRMEMIQQRSRMWVSSNEAGPMIMFHSNWMKYRRVFLS